MLQITVAIKQITAHEGGDGVAVGSDFGEGRQTEGDQKNDGENRIAFLYRQRVIFAADAANGFSRHARFSLRIDALERSEVPRPQCQIFPSDIFAGTTGQVIKCFTRSPFMLHGIE
jgi:hypothetical protein